MLKAKSRIRSVSYLTWSYSSFTTMDEVIWSGLVFYSRSLFYKLGYVRSKDGLKQSHPWTEVKPIDHNEKLCTWFRGTIDDRDRY